MTDAPIECPVVSIMIACYNYGHFVARSVESALGQQWPSECLDVIVVDDGSTDDTMQVLARFGDRIRVHHQPNSGVMAAYAKLVELARGDYLCLVSADDTLPPDRLVRQVEFLRQRPGVALTYGDMRIIDASDNVLTESFFTATGRTPIAGDIFGALLAGNQVSGGGMMWRRTLNERILPLPSAAPWEDWWTAICAAEVGSVEPTPGPAVYNYRHHDSNMNLGTSGAKFVGLLERELPFRRYLLSERDLGRATAAEVLSASLRLEESAWVVARQTGRSMTDIFEVSDESRHRASELVSQAFSASDPAVAVRCVVAALALDPWCGRARLVRDQLADETGMFASATHPGLAALELRELVAVASADELSADPSLLAAWGQGVSSRHSATLVAHGDSSDPGQLAAALASAGLDGADGPDIVLTGFADDQFILALDQRATAWLGSGLPPAGFSRAWPWPADRIDELTGLLL